MPQPLIIGEKPQDFNGWVFTAMIVKNDVVLINASYLIDANYYGNEKIRVYFKIN